MRDCGRSRSICILHHLINDVVKTESSGTYDHDRPKHATGLRFPFKDSNHSVSGRVLDVLSEFMRVPATEPLLEARLRAILDPFKLSDAWPRDTGRPNS